MSPPTEPPLDWTIRRARYNDAKATGQRLVAALESLPTVPQPQAIDMESVYDISGAEFHPRRIQFLAEFPTSVLRSYNVDTNRLSWCQVYTRGDDESNITLTRSDAYSGILFINELNRANDHTPRNDQMPISELLWQSYMRDATEQSMLPSSLRIVWVDTIINDETKIVA